MRFPHTCQTGAGFTEGEFYYGFGGKIVKFLLADWGKVAKRLRKVEKSAVRVRQKQSPGAMAGAL